MMNELEKVMAQELDGLMDEVATDEWMPDDATLEEMAEQAEYERMAETGLALW